MDRLLFNLSPTSGSKALLWLGLAECDLILW